MTLPHGASPALSEITNSSLINLHTSQSLATHRRESGGECESDIAIGMLRKMRWMPSGGVFPEKSVSFMSPVEDDLPVVKQRLNDYATAESSSASCKAFPVPRTSPSNM